MCVVVVHPLHAVALALAATLPGSHHVGADGSGLLVLPLAAVRWLAPWLGAVDGLRGDPPLGALRVVLVGPAGATVADIPDYEPTPVAGAA